MKTVLSKSIETVLLIVSLALAPWLYAEPLVINSEKVDGLQLGRSLLLLEDKDGRLTVEDVAALPASAFFSVDEDVPNFSFTNSAYWARLEIRNTTNLNLPLIVEYGYSFADYVDFYSSASDGSWKKLEGGDRRPASKRQVRHRLSAFPYELASGVSIVVIRVQTQGINQFPVRLWSPQEFHEHSINDIALLIFISGILVVMIFYNLIVGVQTKNTNLYIYVSYLVAHTVSFVWGVCGLSGLTRFDEFTMFSMNLGYLLTTLTSAFFACLLCARFLEITRAMKLSFYSLHFAMGFTVFLFFFTMVDYNIGSRFAALASILCLSSILVASSQRVLHRYRPAYFFMFAWSAVLLGHFLLLFALTGVIPVYSLFLLAPSIGTVMEVVLISLAIGDKMRNQIELALAENSRINAELISKEKARTLFFQNTSHELRTPLNGIIGFLQLLDQGRYGSMEEIARDQVQKCIRLAQGLKNQVNTILDIAKSRQGHLSLVNQVIPLENFAMATEDLATGLMLRYKNSTFKMDRSWSADLDSFVMDHERLRMLVQNLLGNAFKFADAERPNHVHIVFSRDATSLQIAVSDTGIGIADDKLGSIFNEFEQVAGDARRAYEGTGLGLTIVRDIVALVGGIITVESKPGSGSQFVVCLPEQKEVHLASSQDVAANSAQQRSQTSRESPLSLLAGVSDPGNGPRILVVDDHEVNCELLQEILREEGYRVSFALRGDQALKMMREEHPELVLLDMMMPYMSGEDVMKEMQTDELLEHIPVILITARASEDDRVHGLGLGADDYIAKPINAQELVLRVGNLLKRLNMTQESTRKEQDDSFRQLGEMFAFISHEIKNIQQGIGPSQKLQYDEYIRILRCSPLSEDLISVMALSLSENRSPDSLQTQIDMLPPAPKGKGVLRLLRTDLAMLALPRQETLAIWEKLLESSESEQEGFGKLLQLLLQYRSLLEAMHRSQEIFQSALGFIREEQSQHCHMWDALDATISMAALRARKNTIKFQAEIKRMEIAMAPMALQQIVLNLIGNAIDAVSALPPGERYVRVWVEEPSATGRVRLKVLNSGPAIGEDIAARLFQRGMTTKGSKGNGLGLYFSKKLARRFHGDLCLEREGEQTCFVLELEASKPEPQGTRLVKSA